MAFIGGERNVSKIAKAIWGDQGKKNRRTLSNYINKGYRYVWQIPKAGRKPMLGIIGDAALAAFTNHRAHYGQALDDDDINEMGADMYNKLNDLDPNRIDLTLDDSDEYKPPAISAKLKLNRRRPSRRGSAQQTLSRCARVM